jgi:hypothetical protein
MRLQSIVSSVCPNNSIHVFEAQFLLALTFQGHPGVYGSDGQIFESSIGTPHCAAPMREARVVRDGGGAPQKHPEAHQRQNLHGELKAANNIPELKTIPSFDLDSTTSDLVPCG